jgi:hypothetical protein
MANHVLECPNCHSLLLIAHNTSLGGVVQDNLVLVDSAKETPAAAAARATWEAAVTAQDTAQKALDAAQATLDTDAAATPVDDAKIATDTAAVDKAKADLATATKATADADAAYTAARNLPLPPAIGALSPDGNWSWTGDEWEEVTKTPPPLPPGVVAETPAEEAAEDAPVPASSTAVNLNG